ncbi:MAG: FtsX-like permease family protein, partial [Holophagales bacterium]|nr:FtsX-like permease family protein [Holophagales bacterium]
DTGPMALVGDVRAAVAEVDPEVAVYEVRTLDQHLEASLLLSKLGARFVGLFGGLALVLAAIGLFGLLSHAVAVRTREIGIRMSLGADAREIFARVLREGLGLVGVGLLVGLAAAVAAGKMLAGLLYGVSATEPVLVTTVGGLLVATALLAMVLPARRATRVDPIRALREE